MSIRRVKGSVGSNPTKATNLFDDPGLKDGPDVEFRFPLDGITVQVSFLVVRSGTKLPQLCVKTGRPAFEEDYRTDSLIKVPI